MTRMDIDDAQSGYEAEAAEWCWRLADRPLTHDEQVEYDAWLNRDPRHQQILDEMVSVWKNTDAIADMPGFLSLRAKALSMMDSAGNRSDAPPGRSLWRHGLAAAAAILLMLLSGVWYLSDRPDIYATGVGERRLVNLDDGSRVSLDASSRVAISYGEARRSIVLEQGRAKFDVARDPLRPFAVTAGQRTVVATGTAFSVELLRDQMRVLLYEGQVEVLSPPAADAPPTSRSDRRPVDRLRPGQELVAALSGGATSVLPAEVERSLSWEGGRLDFRDEPLSRAVERINRYADVPIVVGDASAGRYRVNGVFDAGDTDSFVSGITALFPLSARHDGEKIELQSMKEEKDEINRAQNRR